MTDTNLNLNLLLSHVGEAVSTSNVPGVYASPSGAAAPTLVNLGDSSNPKVVIRAAGSTSQQSAIQWTVSGDNGGGLSWAARIILRSVSGAVGYIAEPRVGGSASGLRTMLNNANRNCYLQGQAQIGSAYALPLDTELILQQRLKPGPTGTGDGAAQQRILSADGATVLQDASSSTVNLLAGLVNLLYWGNLTTAQGLTLDMWALHLKSDAYELVNPAPVTTGDAGPDQTGVEPFTTVTLTGTGTGTWAQTSGTTVALSGTGNTRTFTVPAENPGWTGGFTFGGDPMTVSALPWDIFEWSSAASAWLPRRFVDL